ncbi:oligosaccharide flippase family protein [Halobacterium sp. KA-6]|uniref:oligosaccharide flippase family protein n=1 Tax=Halobacterium sp. KA-6 TaxID=2896368 RepID=UPI001E4A42B0|nr:oligosaccharide flippase family protein [Halobacterium sp. KA-6]MCD2204874.1 oligosaccharide flippase family protein [Halobacterium sp. KA-6]
MDLQKKSIVSLVSISLIGGLLGKGLRYLTNVVIARELGAEALGIFAVGVVSVKFLGVVSRLGLDKAPPKFIPSQEDDSKISGTVILSLGMPILVGILVSVVGYVVLDKIDAFGYEDSLRLFFVGVPVIASMMVGVSATTGFKETKYSVYVKDLIQSFSALLFVGIGAYLVDSLQFSILGYIASFVLGLGASVYFLFKLGAFDARPDFEVGKVLTFSVPLLVASMTQFVVSWTDIFMLGLFVPANEVGWYQAAYQTSILLLVGLSSVNTIFPSIASGLFSDGSMTELGKIYRVVTKWLAYISSLLFVLIVIFHSEILSIFKISATEAKIALVILCFGQTASAVTGPVGLLLIMSDRERVESVNSTLLAVLNLGLNFFLIQEMGIVGAAIATAASITILNIVRVTQVWWFFGFKPIDYSYYKGVFGIAGATLFAVMAARMTPNGIFSMMVISGFAVVIFSVTIILFGFGEDNEVILQNIK